MLKRSNHMPISTRIETTYSVITWVRGFFEKRTSGAKLLQTYWSQKAQAYCLVALSKSEARSLIVPVDPLLVLAVNVYRRRTGSAALRATRRLFSFSILYLFGLFAVLLLEVAVKAVLPFAFATLGLHRLEAACLPHNLPSTRVLEKTGFKREGMARRYLKINGVWQDHDLFALLQDDAGV